MITVAMHPHVDDLQPSPTAGISQVVKHYFEHLPAFDIQLLPKGRDDADLMAIHAGAYSALPRYVPIVSHCHGLYFTADKPMDIWTHDVNATVIDIVRHAHTVTVPSRWVAEIFQRDMHLNPAIIPHGVNWQEWVGGDDQGYVLWNKNRASDACDPTPVNQLAKRAMNQRFLATYAAPDPSPNIKTTGTVIFERMKEMILGCSVYLATTKETFGIGTLEAMAAGKPILGFDYGGTADLVKHGYSGYLARPGDYDDLTRGLHYCLKHRKALGKNAAEVARSYTWEASAREVAQQYARTVRIESDPDTVAVVIPMYNKASTILRAIRSAAHQTLKPDVIVVINNNSTDNFASEIEAGEREVVAAGIGFYFANCAEQGVAHARNLGVEMAGTKYICCLDADDEIMPKFLEVCVKALSEDSSLGIAYTAMEVVNPEGKRTVSAWPGEFVFDQTLRGRNQVPTCNVFRRDLWRRVGGYRQRYAPMGAGAEDADLWLRISLAGYGGKLASTKTFFRYYLGGAVSGNPDYREKDWRGDKAWITSGELPFATPAKPRNDKAHLVRQYDEPEISIVIPVGQGHVHTLMDALDSIEGQSYRKWEVIVVRDDLPASDNDYRQWSRILDAYPYVRFTNTPTPKSGAGVARNHGAALAKAPLLLFLDADDWLTPSALEDLIAVHESNPEAIVYSDYFGHAFIEGGNFLDRLRQEQRLIDYNTKTLEAKIRYFAFEYDCDRAQRQPIVGQEPYVWNIVTSLMPTAYHREIGGFDEKMPSWEDWDYWVRLARQGKCFLHLAKPLVEYRFYTGSRRTSANPYESGESGRQLSSHLLEYMRNKYEGTETMPCSSCGGGRRSSPPPAAPTARTANEGGLATMSASDMVTVELVDGNIGEHLIAVQGTSYGYRSHGDRFQMTRAHATVDRRVQLVTPDRAARANVAQPPREEPPPPPNAEPEAPPKIDKVAAKPEPKPEPKPEDEVTVITSNAYDLVSLWGIDEDRAQILLARGVRTPDGIVALGAEKVAKILGVADLTAKRIVSEANKVSGATAAS